MLWKKRQMALYHWDVATNQVGVWILVNVICIPTQMVLFDGNYGASINMAYRSSPHVVTLEWWNI